MVVFTIKLHQLRFKVCTDAGKYRTQVVKNLFCEDAMAIFGYEDQVDMKQRNAVSPMANIIVISTHRPTIIDACNAYKPTNTN